MEPAIPPTLKRSLTPSFGTDEDEPSPKTAKGDSFLELQRAERDVHDLVNELLPKVLTSFAAVKSTPVTKWSSLNTQMQARMSVVRKMYRMIILNRCPGFKIQDPQEDTPFQLHLPSNSQDTHESSTPESSNKLKLKKLLAKIRNLSDRLEKYCSRIKSKEDQKILFKVTHEICLLEHYSKKIPELKEIKLPDYYVKTDLLLEVPKREFKLLSKIMGNPLFQRSQILSSQCTLLFDLAQKIYDHYQEARKSYDSCAHTFREYLAIHQTYLPQLVEAKQNRRFIKDEDALKHVQKTQKRCDQQQKRLHTEPKMPWEEAKLEEGASKIVFEKQEICQKPVVWKALKGTRPQKTDLEDFVGATEITCRIKKKKIVMPLHWVMDGHGGPGTASLCCEQLPKVFSQAVVNCNKDGLTFAGLFNAGKETCIELQKNAPEISGATLLFSTIFSRDDQDYLIVYFVGDSRALIIDDKKAIPLTLDASASESYFQDKVRLRGGTIIHLDMDRVEGLRLNLTRSIGDKQQKDHSLIRTPMYNIYPIPKHSEKTIYLLENSDGISGVASDGQLFEFIRGLDAEGVPMADIASLLLRRAHIANGPAGDDVSLVLVKLSTSLQKKRKTST